MKVYDVEQHRSYEVDPKDIDVKETKSRSGFTYMKDETDTWQGFEVAIRKSAWDKYPELIGMDYILRTSPKCWNEVVKEVSRKAC